MDADVKEALDVLGSMPVPAGYDGQKAQSAFRLLKRTIQEQQTMLDTLRRGGLVDFDRDLRPIFEVMPQLPLTRDTMNFERCRDANLAFTRFLTMYAKAERSNSAHD